MFSTPIFILAVLFLLIAFCEFLVQKTWFKHLGTAMLVILMTAIVANIGLIPSASDAPTLYDHIFRYVAPLAIFFLLLEANVTAIKKAGLPLLFLFIVGSFGTVIGALIAGKLVDGFTYLGSSFPVIAGMFTGTYTGGSINFNAVALHYDIYKDGTLYAGAVAIDNILTALWMLVTIGLPLLWRRYHPKAKIEGVSKGSENILKETQDTELVNPTHLSLLLVLGLLTLLFSNWLSKWFANFGVTVPSILILTTVSLILAQVKTVQALRGGRVMGMIGIYLFLAIIGAYCDLSALPGMGITAYTILCFAAIIVLTHGIIIFLGGTIFRQDWDLIAIASQANVGGSGSALALARSLERQDLLFPAILLGTLGNALGTYLGFLVVGFF